MTGTPVSATGFVALLFAALALEVRGRRRADAATVAQALGAGMRTTPGRIAVLVWWIWFGIHFLAR